MFSWVRVANCGRKEEGEICKRVDKQPIESDFAELERIERKNTMQSVSHNALCWIEIKCKIFLLPSFIAPHSAHCVIISYLMLASDAVWRAGALWRITKKIKNDVREDCRGEKRKELGNEIKIIETRIRRRRKSEKILKNLPAGSFFYIFESNLYFLISKSPFSGFLSPLFWFMILQFDRGAFCEGEGKLVSLFLLHFNFQPLSKQILISFLLMWLSISLKKPFRDFHLSSSSSSSTFPLDLNSLMKKNFF